MPATVNGVPTAPDSHGIVYGDGIATNGNYTGTSSSDHLAGTGGNDQLQGGSGIDYYYGAGGNDTFKLTAKDFDTTSGDCQKFIYDFGGAGGWSASNNDFLNLSGFGAGAKLTFDHDAAQKSTNYPSRCVELLHHQQ